MLVVKHLTGPLKGQEDRIDPKLDKVVFGRKADCQIIYPPEETIVAREHFALMRKPPGPAGHWTIDLFGEPFVAVDGVAADQGQQVSQDTVFELGKKGGPSFKVHFEADATVDNLPQTDSQSHTAGPRAVAAFSRKVAFLGLAIAIVAGGAATFYHFSTAKLQIGSDVRDRLTRSVFLVNTPTSGGTAFPIGPHLLATNSHVGELYEELKPGQKMVVRSPGRDGKIYEVIDHKLHPGYRAFEKFLEQDVLRKRTAQLYVPGYDVALLQVKEELPADAILELATLDELQSLAPGAVIATAGYPMEGVIGSPVQSYGATPELHVGTVTGFTDFFFLPTDFARSQLMHDDLPAAGGSSGSPIVGRSGHVVALLNAGNSYSPGQGEARVPSGVLVNYAQRVDMLRHLLDGDADSEVAQDQKYWAEKFAIFPTGAEIAVNRITNQIREHEKNDNIKLVSVSEETGNLSQQDRVNKGTDGFQRQADHTVAVSGGSEYAILAYAYNGSPLQIWVYDGGKLLGHGADDTILPYVLYKAANDTKLDVWVIGPEDQDVKYSFQVLKIAPAREAK